jgi:hypothetical protein
MGLSFSPNCFWQTLNNCSRSFHIHGSGSDFSSPKFKIEKNNNNFSLNNYGFEKLVTIFPNAHE